MRLRIASKRTLGGSVLLSAEVIDAEYCRGVRLEDAADDNAFGKHVEPDERLVGPTTSGSL
jgi:hypothetical protein